MSENSDGRNERTKEKVDLSVTIKTRSQSVSSQDKQLINHPNLLDGVETRSQKKSKIDKLDFNIYRDQSNSSPITFNENGLNNEGGNVYIDELDIFKSKNSIPHSPPHTPAENDANGQKGSGKRIRSNTTPENIDRYKVRKQIDENNIDLNSEQKPKEDEMSEEHTIKSIESVLNSLEVIHSILENSEPKKTAEYDISEARSALFNVHKVMTKMAYKLGQLEKERTDYLNQGNRNMKHNTEKELMYENTYSSITQRQKLDKVTKQNQKKEEWKTPPKETKHEMVIRINEKTDAKKVMHEIKQSFVKNNVTENVKRVAQLQSGSVVMECHNEEQQTKIKNILVKEGGFLLKEKENTDPMILVTGIEKGYDPKEFIEELVEQNPESKTCIGETVMEDIRYVTKRPCRNQRKENWVLQMKPEIFKWFIKNQKISFDLTKLYVQEYYNIAMCFKCCNFGHVAKFCNSPNCCAKCGREHETRDCPEDVGLDCPNCKN